MALEDQNLQLAGHHSDFKIVSLVGKPAPCHVLSFGSRALGRTGLCYTGDRVGLAAVPTRRRQEHLTLPRCSWPENTGKRRHASPALTGHRPLPPPPSSDPVAPPQSPWAFEEETLPDTRGQPLAPRRGAPPPHFRVGPLKPVPRASPVLLLGSASVAETKRNLGLLPPRPRRPGSGDHSGEDLPSALPRVDPHRGPGRTCL